jgi:hypothetical protein
VILVCVEVLWSDQENINGWSCTPICAEELGSDQKELGHGLPLDSQSYFFCTCRTALIVCSSHLCSPGPTTVLLHIQDHLSYVLLPPNLFWSDHSASAHMFCMNHPLLSPGLSAALCTYRGTFPMCFDLQMSSSPSMAFL